MSQISDPIIYASLAALTAAVAALWGRSELLIRDRARLDRRFTRLLARLATCPLTACPFRAWSHDELLADDADDDHPTPTSRPSHPVPCPVPLHPVPPL